MSYTDADPSAAPGTEEYVGNQILVCDNCNAAVHQFCYGRGIAKVGGIPEGDWFCERCKMLKNNPGDNPAEYCCDLCNDLKGIII